MPRLAALLIAALLTIVGCSSSGGHSTTSAPTSSNTANKQATALGASMRKGMAALTSAHIDVDAGSLGGKTIGDVKYANGEATASKITLDVDGKVQIITVGDTSYAMVPSGRNTSGKPWVIVSADSKNEFVRALASQVTISKAAASLPAIADVASTATTVQDKGTSAGGHHYALQIDPSRSKGSTLGTMLNDLGEKSIPVDLYLDKTGRPVLIRIAVTLGTQSFPIVIKVSKFNAPVQISAPPADQVAS